MLRDMVSSIKWMDSHLKKYNSNQLKIYPNTPDYWILIEDEELMPNFELWLEKLKSIDKIQMAYVFPPEKAIKFTWVNLLQHL